VTGRGGGRLWLAGLIAVAGLSLLAFPPVTNAVYDHRVAALAQTFQQTAQGVGDTPESHEDLYQYLKAENEHLFHTGQAGMVDAFAYETTHIDLSEYGLADNLIGFIAIPSIGIELPIYLGANRENLKQGAVHLTQTSYPIGGDNTKAALMTRGIYEITRLGVAMGAKAETFGGLSGIGDLIVTCTSMHSRNRRAGILIGQGKSPEEAIQEIKMVVEGINTCRAAKALAAWARRILSCTLTKASAICINLPPTK